MCKEEIVLGFPFICIYRQKKRERRPMASNWTVEQQQALDKALQMYPDTLDRRERWRYSFLLSSFYLASDQSQKWSPERAWGTVSQELSTWVRNSQKVLQKTRNVFHFLWGLGPRLRRHFEYESFLFFSMSLGCDFLYYVEEESVEVTNEESGDDSKKTPTEIIEPYLSSMDESVKEYSESTSSCQK